MPMDMTRRALLGGGAAVVLAAASSTLAQAPGPAPRVKGARAAQRGPGGPARRAARRYAYGQTQSGATHVHTKNGPTPPRIVLSRGGPCRTSVAKHNAFAAELFVNGGPTRRAHIITPVTS